MRAGARAGVVAAVAAVFVAGCVGGLPDGVAVTSPAGARRAERPRAFVRVDSVRDRSRRPVPAARRRQRASDVRAWLLEDLRAAPAITVAPERARALGVPRFGVDVAIERLERRRRGRAVEIACELRVSVTDERGKMLFVLTNGAAVRVPRDGFRREHEPLLQRDALEGAARGINEALIARLEAAAGPPRVGYARPR